jgi:adenylate cyclase
MAPVLRLDAWRGLTAKVRTVLQAVGLLMPCVGCGFDISPDFSFCPRCGRRQPTRCVACGFSCEPDFAFCPRCGVARVTDGTRLRTTRAEVVPTDLVPAVAGVVEPPSVARPGVPIRGVDRRQVTVLFADLSGFTALSERLDPEEVHSFQNGFCRNSGIKPKRR